MLEGSWGCRSRRESDSQVTWHRVCQLVFRRVDIRIRERVSPIVKKRQAVAGSGWEAAAVVGRLGGGGAVRRGFVVMQRQVLQSCFDPGWCLRLSSSTEWTVYEMACFLCFPLLCTETGTHSAFFLPGCGCCSTLTRSSMSWERGCSMEACERISHIFYVLLALFAWNLDVIS